MASSLRLGALVLASFAAGIAVLAAPPATSASTEVDITVKNWSFTPSTVETHVGQSTVLRFTDSEGVHGVESSDVGIEKTMITPGKVSEVTFTPKTAGTFAVHCAIVCGEGHDKMVLTVKVLS